MSNLERAFILAALEDNKRTDGRLLNERRDLSIDFGREEGYVITQQNSTHRQGRTFPKNTRICTNSTIMFRPKYL